MVEVNNLTRYSLNETFFRKVAERVLAEEKQKKELSIAFVTPQRSKELNALYRKKDTVANVLSFSAGNERIPSEVEGYLGEVILCPSQIRKDAKKYGMIFEQALAWMLVHGILHMVGYAHKKESNAAHMEQKERVYLSHI